MLENATVTISYEDLHQLLTIKGAHEALLRDINNAYFAEYMEEPEGHYHMVINVDALIRNTIGYKEIEGDYSKDDFRYCDIKDNVCIGLMFPETDEDTDNIYSYALADDEDPCEYCELNHNCTGPFDEEECKIYVECDEKCDSCDDYEICEREEKRIKF